MTACRKILILNGPNLNMLGVREPAVYGTDTLKNIEKLCRDRAKKNGQKISFRQSNHEGELVTWIQKARGNFDALIINAGAYTHTSIALHDALKIFEGPVVEVHMSDPKKRETFRHISYIEPLAATVISGQGPEGYAQALDYLCKTSS